MPTLLALVLMLGVGLTPALAADPAQKSRAPIGNGETAVATSPPAAPNSELSAMPRTTAQRLRAARPEMIFGVLAALMLLTGLVVGVRTIVVVYRRR